MKRICFNKGWKFNHGINTAMAAGFMGASVKKHIVDLPHDGMISMGRSPEAPAGASNGFFQTGNCEYTKTFSFPADTGHKVVYMECGGAYMNAAVQINGDYAGGCHNGYVNFLTELTDFIKPGIENTVKITLKNAVQPNGRWYTGCGLYRGVDFLVSGEFHIIPDGIRITTVSIQGNVAALDVETMVRWRGTGFKKGCVISDILDEEGNLVVSVPAVFGIRSQETICVRQRIYIENPKLWSTECPTLYVCKSRLEEMPAEGEEEPHGAGEPADSSETEFGIRILTLDCRNGLTINGKSVKLKGGCLHLDNGLIGAASFYDAEERRIRKLKEAGYNAVRISHNPSGKVLLEACDRAGMLVVEEFTDSWTQPKQTYDYGMYFPDDWEKDVENIVRHVYNHPSVILYSIGNEIPETGSTRASGWGRKAAEKIRTLDRTRFITNGINITMSVIDKISVIASAIGTDAFQNGASPEQINDIMNNMGELLPRIAAHPLAEHSIAESCDLLDVVGINYSAETYERMHKTYSQRIFLGSETRPGDLDRNWELVKKHGYVIGDFSWTAWDYLGEAGIGRIEIDTGNNGECFTGVYPWIAADTGDFDLTGHRRTVSYWRETVWNGRDHIPYIAVEKIHHKGRKLYSGSWSFTDTVHSWTWPGYEGQQTGVEVYADTEEVELFLNGRSLGRKQTGADRNGHSFYVRWDVDYEPGTLEAVTYLNGKEAGRALLETAHNAQLTVIPEQSELSADRNELCYFNIELKNAKEILDMSDNSEVTVGIDGPAILLGCGSADPCMEEAYSSQTHRLWHGRLQAVVRLTGETGKVRITADGGSLGKACAEVSVR